MSHMQRQTRSVTPRRSGRGFLALLAGAALLGGLGAATQASAADKVKFNMSWLPQGSVGGIIVAIGKGYYEEVGLEVEAVRGFGGIRTTNEIDQGLFEFGYGNPLGIVLNRSKGGKTRMIGAINDSWPGGLCYVADRHKIKTPADLKGLSVGGGQHSPVQVMMPAWLERNGVDRSEIKLLQLDPAVVDASLIEGKIDAAECWLGSNMALLEKRAREADVNIDWIRYGDFKLDIYGSGVVTSDALIQKNPEMVERFVDATYEGYEYLIANPEEAADIIVKQFPVLDRDVTLQQVKETIDLIKGPGKLGTMRKEKMESTLEFLASAYDVKESLSADELYTNKFIE